MRLVAARHVAAQMVGDANVHTGSVVMVRNCKRTNWRTNRRKRHVKWRNVRLPLRIGRNQTRYGPNAR